MDNNSVIVWQDNRGWLYFVRSGIGQSNYKGFYAKNEQDYNGNIRQHGMRAMEWKHTHIEAQVELNKYGESKGWAVYKSL